MITQYVDDDTSAFTGVFDTDYWSATTFTFHVDTAWTMETGIGRSNYIAKSSSIMVWPVRD